MTEFSNDSNFQKERELHFTPENSPKKGLLPASFIFQCLDETNLETALLQREQQLYNSRKM
jgi:hypothetical protein